MNYQEFKNTISSKNRFYRYVNYTMCMVALAGGVTASINLAANTLTGPNRYLMYIIPFFFLLVGAYGLYVLPKQYKIITLSSPLPMVQKGAIIEQLQAGLGLSPLYSQASFHAFGYQKNWWTCTHNIYLLYDEDSFYFNVQNGARSRSGFIDFGSSERLRRKTTAILSRLINK